MNSTFCKASSMRFTKCAKFSIARLCGLSLLFFGLAGNAEAQLSPADSATLSSILGTLNSQNSKVGSIYETEGLILQALEYWMLPGLQAIHNDLQSNGEPTLERIYYALTNLNALAGSDGLLSNPWWATNSDFALSYPNYSKVFPDDGRTDNAVYSFPQLMSLWSSRLSVKDAAPTKADMQSSWYNRFGIPEMSANASVARRNQLSYTWFDWMADFQRSNLVFREFLETYPSSFAATNETLLDDEYASSVVEDMPTNSLPVLPEFEIQRPSRLTGYSDVSGAFEDLIDDVKPQPTTGSPVLEVIPAFSVGGISVARKTFDFSSSITPYCRAVMSFIWGVMAGCMIFRLLSQEWAFYTSLGRSVE